MEFVKSNLSENNAIIESDEPDEPIFYDKNSRTSLMELVEPILKKYYTKPIGSIDISTLSNSGTGYLYAKLIDDFTIVRLMHDEKRIGYIIQIREYSTGIQRRNALLFSYRPDKLGFNFDGFKEFYKGCYIDSRDVLEVIKNLRQLITRGSVDVTNESYDWVPDAKTFIKNKSTHKIELHSMM